MSNASTFFRLKWLQPFFALVLLLVGVSLSAKATEYPDFEKLASDNAISVVNITAYSRSKAHSKNQLLSAIPPELRPYFDVKPNPKGTPGDKRMAYGSGFIWDAKNGYILTNYHVIDGAFRVVITYNDRRQVDAKILGSDKLADIAILSVPTKNLRQVKILQKDEVLRPGQPVMAIGSPFGLDYTVTSGIISAVARALPSSAYVPFIQSDVAINPGNSGGPLFNIKGEVVGINSQIFTRTGEYAGISFSIPIDYAVQTAKTIVKNGKVTRGYLGINIGDVNFEIAKAYGLSRPQGGVVTHIFKGSPAEKFGIQVEDIVLKIDDKDIKTFNDIPLFVGQMLPDTTHTFIIWRNEKEKTIQLKLGTLPKQDKKKAKKKKADVKDTKNDSSKLGITIRSLTNDERKKVKTNGVLVTKLRNGPATEAGIQVGDLIERINRKKITTTKDLQKVKLPKGKQIPIVIFRRGVTIILTVIIPIK